MSDEKYLIEILFRLADEGVSFAGLDDPQEWIWCKWTSLGGDPDKEFTLDEFLALYSRPQTGNEGD